MCSTENIENSVAELSIPVCIFTAAGKELVRAIYSNEDNEENFSKIITELSKANQKITFYIKDITPKE